MALPPGAPGEHGTLQSLTGGDVAPLVRPVACAAWPRAAGPAPISGPWHFVWPCRRVTQAVGTVPVAVVSRLGQGERQPGKPWPQDGLGDNLLTHLCVRQVSASRKTANLGRKALADMKQLLGGAPERERRPSAVHVCALAGAAGAALCPALLFLSGTTQCLSPPHGECVS